MKFDLTLRLPREDEDEEFLRAHRATSPEVPSFLHHYVDGMSLRRYLDVLSARERGIDLPSDVAGRGRLNDAEAVLRSTEREQFRDALKVP